MAISHVIRGEDHLSNTPKHILLFRALGADAAGLRAPAAHPQSRPHEDEQAQEPDRGRGLSRAGLRQGGPRQPPRAARLVGGRRRRGLRARGPRSTASSSSASSRAARSSTPSGSPGSTASGSGCCRPTSSSSARCRSWSRDVERAAAAGARMRTPTADDLAALLPMVRERLPRLDAIGPMLDFVFIDDIALDPAALVPEALGRGDDRDRPRGRAPTRSGASARSRSRRTSSSRRCGRSPRPAAGSRATSSWPCASRSPAAPRRRHCSTRWWRVGYERSAALDAACSARTRDRRRRDDAMTRDEFAAGSTATSRPGGAATRPRSATSSARTRSTAITAAGRPVEGREAIVASWLEDPDPPGSFEASYEPLAIDGEIHVARADVAVLRPRRRASATSTATSSSAGSTRTAGAASFTEW